MARALALLVVVASLVAGALSSAGQDARAAVEAFVARLQDVSVADLTIVQHLTLYHPDGQHPQSAGEQRVLFKLPLRQRLEQTVEGRREVQLTVADRAWIRRGDGRIDEVPATAERASDRIRLLVPLRRTAAELLAEWRALGVRDDVSHVVRIAGRSVTVVGAKPGDRDVPAVWVDPEYGVVRVVTRRQLPQGPALVDLTFSEHRPLVGGFYFPYRQEAFANGKLLLLITVRAVRANTGLPDSLFDPDAFRAEP